MVHTFKVHIHSKCMVLMMLLCHCIPPLATHTYAVVARPLYQEVYHPTGHPYLRGGGAAIISGSLSPHWPPILTRWWRGHYIRKFITPLATHTYAVVARPLYQEVYLPTGHPYLRGGGAAIISGSLSPHSPPISSNSNTRTWYSTLWTISLKIQQISQIYK